MRQILAFCLSLFSLVQIAAAEPKHHDTFGSIDLEEDTATKDPYGQAQDAAISSIDALAQAAQNLGTGGSGSVTDISSQANYFLTGAYLFCLSKKAICPALPRTILELDIINSKKNKAASCPNMLRFWDAWIKNDMEQRHKYMVQTAFMRDVGEFNTKERPKLIKCQATVEEIISGTESEAEFFKKRYAAGSPAISDIQNTRSMLAQIKEKVPNVFKATGAIN